MPNSRNDVRAYAIAVIALLLGGFGCGEESPIAPQETAQVDELPRGVEVPDLPPPVEEPSFDRPTELWVDGHSNDDVEYGDADYLFIDIGEAWTPYLFSEQDAGGEHMPNAYRSTYLALSQGRFPSDHHGARARKDKYLELFGIMPTLGLLRERFRTARALECREELDLSPLENFEGTLTYRNRQAGPRAARRFNNVERLVNAMVERQGVASYTELNRADLNDRDRGRLRDYTQQRTNTLAIRAAQDRLKCEGYFEDKGDYVYGALDWETHEALAEFERRHRIYGWGYIGRDSLEALRLPTLELERQAVVRVLVERAVHAAGVIEDGSRSEANGRPRMYIGADGARHPMRNLVEELETLVIQSFGLETPESTFEWLETLGETPGDESRFVALPGFELPEYYSDDMELHVQIDRGDVWYEFPYDEEGRERGQPVARRPQQTLFTEYRGQTIPLARFGTTVGGWRSEYVNGQTMWKYKGSPVGPRVWSRIVASPVWMPPDTTPPRSLLVRDGRGGFTPNYHETGPSYASAYGLVAAYHQMYSVRDDGTYRLGGDEGIRTHGSVDYMSIMRRHSHGCHRMHNHMAVRMMSFVLQHRAHRRVGQQGIGYHLDVPHGGEVYSLDLEKGGYVYRLNTPLRVQVLTGRIRGRRTTPIEHPLPKYDRDVGAYVMPDGTHVTVDRMGTITPLANQPPGVGTEIPVADGTVIDGAAVPGAVPPPAPGAPAPGAPAPSATTRPSAAPTTPGAPGAPPGRPAPGVLTNQTRPTAPPAGPPTRPVP